MPNGILIVEDEPMLQMYWEDICSMADVKIGGIAGTIAEAHGLMEKSEFSAAVLDVNLKGETTEALAEYFRDVGTPVLVSTGSHPGELPSAYLGMSVIQKPFRPLEMEKALKSLLKIAK